MPGKIERDFAGSHSRATVPLVPPDHGTNARLKLIEVERLHNVIIGAAVETRNPARHIIAGGDDKNGCVGAFLPNGDEKLRPGAIRQTEIEQDQAIDTVKRRSCAISTGADPV